MKWLLVAFGLALVTPALAQAASPSTSMTPAPDDRAKQWLTLIDDKNYADAYNQMGELARAKVSEQDFAQKVSAARAPLGAMASRALKDVKLTKTLPGVPDGQYAVVRYDSVFARKAEAIELLTLEAGKGGWSVIGYFIR